jgi:hypothetical protein
MKFQISNGNFGLRRSPVSCVQAMRENLGRDNLYSTTALMWLGEFQFTLKTGSPQG